MSSFDPKKCLFGFVIVVAFVLGQFSESQQDTSDTLEIPSGQTEKVDVKRQENRLEIQSLRILDNNGKPRISLSYNAELGAAVFSMGNGRKGIRETYVFDDSSVYDSWSLQDGTRFYSIQSLPSGTSSIRHLFRDERSLIESRMEYEDLDGLGVGQVVIKETVAKTLVQRNDTEKKNKDAEAKNNTDEQDKGPGDQKRN